MNPLKSKSSRTQNSRSASQRAPKSNASAVASQRENESSSDTDDGQDLFKCSPSPEETFSDDEGANSDDEWPLEIIGEEIDYLGKIRYEVKWDNWKRRTDGTNTTWDNSLIPSAAIREWDSIRTQRRFSKAQKKDEGEKIHPSIRITDMPTLRRFEAVEEREKLHSKQGYSLLTDLIHASQKITSSSHERHNTPANSAAQIEDLKRKSSQVESKQPIASTSKAGVAPCNFPPLTVKKRRIEDKPVNESQSCLIKSKTRAIEEPVSPRKRGRPPKRAPESTSQKPSVPHKISLHDSHEVPADTYTSRPPPTITRPIERRRVISQSRKLADNWTEIAKASGAAYITITNDIDAQEVPRLPLGFQYIETGYVYSQDVPKASGLDEAIFLRCQCQGGCNEPENCSCQEISDLVDEYGDKSIAYDVKGLFTMDVTPGMLVIECNQYCKCNLSCRNRISQRPRKIPIDIFKTADRGWGARPLCDVPMGSVLGMYSGKLMKRGDAKKLDGEERGYCFDLDGQENLYENVEEQQGTYTVDALHCGNWTRFVNHSCSPNLHVYQVVHNTIPELNTPSVIFCAKIDIPANCELTVDYDPRETPLVKKKKKGRRKSKDETMEGSIQCKCGEEGCRRWVMVLA